MPDIINPHAGNIFLTPHKHYIKKRVRARVKPPACPAPPATPLKT